MGLLHRRTGAALGLLAALALAALALAHLERALGPLAQLERLSDRGTQRLPPSCEMVRETRSREKIIDRSTSALHRCEGDWASACWQEVL